MDVLILSASAGWHTDRLCGALAARGHTGRVLPYQSLVARIGGPAGRTPGLTRAHTIDAAPADLRAGAGGEVLSALRADAVLARIVPAGSLEQIIYRVDALHWLEARGVPVVNSPHAIERAVDKFYTTALLHEAGLPVPETVVCETVADAMPAIRTMLAGGGEVIIKPLFGSMGHGLLRAADPELAFRLVRPLEQMRCVFYLQRAIDHDGRDIRAFVIGGRVLAAIERIAPAGEWRTNVARGGAARPYDLPAAWAAMAVQAAAAVGAEYAGVDLLVSRAGEVFVLEVNAIPGWQGLQRATGIDVAGAIVDRLAEVSRRSSVTAGSVEAPA